MEKELKCWDIETNGRFIDLCDISFSRRGAYITFYLDDFSDGEYGHSRLYIGNCNGFATVVNRNKLLSLHALHNGTEVPYSIRTTPATLRMQTMFGYIEFCIAEENLIRIKGEGVTLQLKTDLPGHESAKPREKGCYEIDFAAVCSKLLLMPVKGSIKADMPFDFRMFGCKHAEAIFQPEKNESVFEGAIIEFETNAKKRDIFPPYEQCVKEVEADFNAWRAKLPQVPARYKRAAQWAAYTTWSSIVKPFGLFKVYMMFMNRNRFAHASAWQQSYQAVVHSEQDLDIAWDMLLAIFTLQDEFGQIPDSSTGCSNSFNSVKPPFQGLALDFIMKHVDIGRISDEKVEKLYDHICRWTNWWFAYRDHNGDGIPAYEHGDESGGDDVSMFCKGIPVAGPDLVSFLTIQTDVLSRMAARLHKEKEQEEWAKQSEVLLNALISRFWNGERFVAFQGYDMENEVKTDALNYYLPLMLGERLPKKIRDKMISDLSVEGKYLTPYGFATEALDSPYVEYSYAWTRGTINAPNQFMMVMALDNSGAGDLAETVARRYCDNIEKYGPHQHFNPRTGKPAGSFGFTCSYNSHWSSWASAAFFLLASHYVKD